jgi:hypothetical protein
MAMEDLWKLRDMGYRLGKLGDRAEYDLMIRRFREEEQSSNLRNLLYGDVTLTRDDKTPDKS